MNFHSMDLAQFVTKLKGLIKKISSSSQTQLHAHTQTCHKIVAELLNDQHGFNKLTGQNLRLLAYEAVLFLVQMISSKNQKPKNYSLGNNKIQKLLLQIYQTLAMIRQLLRTQQLKRDDVIIKTLNSKNTPNNRSQNLDRNLDKYQKQLQTILNSVQSISSQNLLGNNKVKSSFSNLNAVDDDNDFILKEMHKIIQRKEKRIFQLTKLIKQAQDQKIGFQIQFKKLQTQRDANNCKLSKRIDELLMQRDNLILRHENERALLEINRKQASQNNLSINLTINEKVNQRFGSQLSDMNFSARTQQLALQSINAGRWVRPCQGPSRKASLDKTGSSRSFRRIGVSQDKELTNVDKKQLKQLAQKNQNFYRFIYCQAITLEELI